VITFEQMNRRTVDTIGKVIQSNIAVELEVALDELYSTATEMVNERAKHLNKSSWPKWFSVCSRFESAAIKYAELEKASKL